MSIILHDISYHHSNRTLVFDQINCSIGTGEHVNLIGNNGSGKSTLLKIMAKQLPPSAGTLTVSVAPYYVPQQSSWQQNQTVADALNVTQSLRALQAILQGDASAENFDLLADRWDIETQIQEALNNWQLDHVHHQTPIQQLSGGEQTRVLLAGMELHQPGIILLDEPTNHLDARGREQLHRFLQQFKGDLVVVSHDRSLLQLNQITLELQNGKLVTYGGDYEHFKQMKEAQLLAMEAAVIHQEKELRSAQKQARQSKERRQRLESRNEKITGLPKGAINGFRNMAEKTSGKLKGLHEDKVEQAASALREKRELLGREHLLKIVIPGSLLHKGKILAKAGNVNHQYAQQLLWPQGLSFQINSGDRIAIRGNNGSGKTTLLKMITGELIPTQGLLERADFKIIYLDQDYSLLDPNNTVVEQLQQYDHLHLEPHQLKILLHRHQLGPEHWDKKCSQLSGGERMKLCLCCLSVSDQHPDMLILDEPANNLDIQSLEILTASIQSYEGTLLLVSHDAVLIDELGIDQYIDL
ncbi:ABC-F family ATP-binding cassette domain-containing protein [Pseudoflavitalea sp. G-6-1-2]|uniref:ABC-F family ATP-binding cassette domain-containing protein n=1 Tax=Pseudoflavitalea sp. G-6-1-2 TaxID=2728841 RepID=UPI00146DEF68|nr:ABC-F family ATP-binding cassette domain-containing protein [Pseudoflavitalea sp. G-6-1-2]NML21260.1 ABC-F family ATP-binding cassette domain-containing protein [Pseudoflavitalea sp. G-6-1-2]